MTKIYCPFCKDKKDVIKVENASENILECGHSVEKKPFVPLVDADDDIATRAKKFDKYSGDNPSDIDYFDRKGGPWRLRDVVRLLEYMDYRNNAGTGKRFVFDMEEVKKFYDEHGYTMPKKPLDSNIKND